MTFFSLEVGQADVNVPVCVSGDAVSCKPHTQSWIQQLNTIRQRRVMFNNIQQFNTLTEEGYVLLNSAVEHINIEEGYVL